MANDPTIQPRLPETAEEVHSLLFRAKNGDQTTLPVIRKLLERPETIEALGGNLAAIAQQSFVDSAAGKDLAVREALNRKLEVLRQELAGPSPSALEMLLVERVVACWLQVQDADVRYAQRGNCTLAQADYYQRRMSHAHKRYLTAIKTLVVVRRLAVPVLQVNIAKKQVNMAGTCVNTDQDKELR